MIWGWFCTFWGGTWLSNSTRIQKTISFVNNRRETPVENSCSPSFLWVFHISYKCWCFSYIYIFPSMYPSRITIYRWLADMKEQYYSYIISPWWTHCITKVANYISCNKPCVDDSPTKNHWMVGRVGYHPDFFMALVAWAATGPASTYFALWAPSA